MVFNTGLFQSNKQTAMNAYFIKNFKKREKNNVNSGILQNPVIGLENSIASVI